MRMVSFMLQSTKNGVRLFPTKSRKQSLKVKTTTLSPRDRDRKAASEMYKFLKEVSLATPRKRKNAAFNPKIIQKEKKINAEIFALSKEIDLLAAEHEQKSKLVSMQSKKVNNFTSPRPEEMKTKTLNIDKAIDLITSQSVDALSQLSLPSFESKTNSSQFIKTPTKSPELEYSSEYLKNSNLRDRKEQLELQLKKIRREIDLLTAEKNEKLSTVDIFAVSIRPTIILFPSSHKFSNPTTTETPTAILTTTKDETITELDIHNIMTHKEDYLELKNKSEAELHIMHEEESVNDKVGREIYSRSTRKSDIFLDSFNLSGDVTLSDSKKQKSEATEPQIDFNIRKKQQLVLEQLDKLLNLTLSKRLSETDLELLNIKNVRQTTETNFGMLRLTKRRSKRPRNMRRTYKIQEKHKLRNRPKHSRRKLKINKESEIDNFRRQLQMEYDSFK